MRPKFHLLQHILDIPVKAATQRMNGLTRMKLSVTGSNLFGSRELALYMLTLKILLRWNEESFLSMDPVAKDEKESKSL